MYNPQFYISGWRPIGPQWNTTYPQHACNHAILARAICLLATPMKPFLDNNISAYGDQQFNLLSGKTFLGTGYSVNYLQWKRPLCVWNCVLNFFSVVLPLHDYMMIYNVFHSGDKCILKQISIVKCHADVTILCEWLITDLQLHILIWIWSPWIIVLSEICFTK